MDATTITLPFGSPADVEKAAWLLAAFRQIGVSFEAEKDGCNFLVIRLV